MKDMRLFRKAAHSSDSPGTAKEVHCLCKRRSSFAVLWLHELLRHTENSQATELKGFGDHSSIT